VVILCPAIGVKDLVTHYGRRVDAPVVLLRPGAETIPGVIAAISDLGNSGAAALETAMDVFADDAHLFSNLFPRLCELLILEGKRVMAAGVNLTFAGQGFGSMPELLAQADEMSLFKAVCYKCGDQHATRSIRLRDGKPVSLRETAVYMPDEHTTHEPICLDCLVAAYGKLSL